ncbi:MAG: ferredoxin--NADP reductase [Flavobacteriaceae bacterium]|nr:ferredoxin--NADP reductase [Flavobacteriaceae bacterium]MDZ4148360.1 ferredoxin--NADP reductase [Flavobacteriaceae bacterium]
MSHFHTLTIREVRRETPDAVSVLFEVPDSLKKEFHFTPGQYLTLKTTIDGKEVRRAYSICASPNSDELRVAVKKVQNGAFSVYANEQLKAGDKLEVYIPEGRFLLHPEDGKSYLAFVAGSGITPVMSMIKTTLKDTKKSKFVLVYGNKLPDDTLFLTELKKLQNQFPERLYIQYVYSRAQESDSLFGRIDSSIVNLIVKNKFKDTNFAGYYLCGPEEMIHVVKDALLANKVPKEAIHFELFTTSEAETIPSTTLAKGKTKLTVYLDGEAHSLEIRQNHSVLESVLEAGIDAPFSCQGGVCSTCIARIKEGSANMAKNTILTDGEIAEGLTLTCQARATSATLTIDYDDV